MSRITEMILEPSVTYTGNTVLVRVKVQDDYKYKKYIISENVKYTTATGESFTLTNVRGDQPGSILEMTGQSIQNGTPTPDAPVEIQSVSGDQNINVMNKNIIQMKEGNYSYSNKTFKVEGTKITFTAPDITYQGGALNLYNGTTGRWAGTGLQNNKLTEYGKQYTFTITRRGTINFNNDSSTWRCDNDLFIHIRQSRNANQNELQPRQNQHNRDIYNKPNRRPKNR